MSQAPAWYYRDGQVEACNLHQFDSEKKYGLVFLNAQNDIQNVVPNIRGSSLSIEVKRRCTDTWQAVIIDQLIYDKLYAHLYRQAERTLSKRAQ